MQDLLAREVRARRGSHKHRSRPCGGTLLTLHVGRAWRAGAPLIRTCVEQKVPAAKAGMTVEMKCKRGPPRAYPRSIRPKPPSNQRLEKSRPELVLGVRGARIITSPHHRGGRPAGDLAGGGGGRAGSGRRGPSGRLRDGPGRVPLSRDEARAAKDRRARQARAEIARVVRTGFRRPSARRGALSGAG